MKSFFQRVSAKIRNKNQKNEWVSSWKQAVHGDTNDVISASFFPGSGIGGGVGFVVGITAMSFIGGGPVGQAVFMASVIGCGVLGVLISAAILLSIKAYKKMKARKQATLAKDSDSPEKVKINELGSSHTLVNEKLMTVKQSVDTTQFPALATAQHTTPATPVVNNSWCKKLKNSFSRLISRFTHRAQASDSAERAPLIINRANNDVRQTLTYDTHEVLTPYVQYPMR